MSEFKVGDKVKVKAGKSNVSKAMDGKIAVIEAVFDTYCQLENEPKGNMYGGIWNYEIKLIEENHNILRQNEKPVANAQAGFVGSHNLPIDLDWDDYDTWRSK